QSAPALPGRTGRRRRRTAQAEGSPPEDVLQAGWPRAARHPVERRRPRGPAHRAEGRRRTGLHARGERVPGREIPRAPDRRLPVDHRPAQPFESGGSSGARGGFPVPGTTRWYNPCMWRKRLRLGIAIFGLIVAAVVLYALRPREARMAATPIEGLDPQATVETRGGEAVQLSGSRQNLRIEFEGQATYPDGQTRLTGVKLMVDNRAGRNFVVTGDEARVGAGNVTYDMSGNVRLEASDGLTATAGSATYVQEEGIVRVPGPVQFQRGQMSGAGIGFTYDEQRNTVWLLDQAVVRFKGNGDEGPMDVASGTAGFARTDRYMRFAGGVRVTRGGQIIEATGAPVFLFPERDAPDRIERRGNASVTGGTGLGALRAMRARDINLDYADDGRTLQQATLAGQSAI